MDNPELYRYKYPWWPLVRSEKFRKVLNIAFTLDRRCTSLSIENANLRRRAEHAEYQLAEHNRRLRGTVAEVTDATVNQTFTPTRKRREWNTDARDVFRSPSPPPPSPSPDPWRSTTADSGDDSSRGSGATPSPAPSPFTSGMGGAFAGAGASATWASESSPSPSPSSYSGGSDSGSSSGGGGDSGGGSSGGGGD